MGCGYLGSAVADAAIARGFQVTALTRNEATAKTLKARGVDVVVADLAGDSWHSQVSAVDCAVDCVGAGGGGAVAFRRSHLQGIQSIVAWARRNRPGTFVYTSSTSVYPGGAGMVVREDSLTGGRDGNTMILIEVENAIRAAAEVFGRWFVLRLAGIYGPGRTHLVEQVRSGIVSGEPQRRLNLIHRDDAAAAILAAFEAPESIGSGVFNLSDGAPAPKREVAEWIAARIGVPPPQYSAKPHPRRAALTPDRIIDSSKIRRDLNWEPRYRSYREGYQAFL